MKIVLLVIFYQNFLSHYTRRIIGDGKPLSPAHSNNQLIETLSYFSCIQCIWDCIVDNFTKIGSTKVSLYGFFFFCVWDIARIMPELGGLLANNDRARSLRWLFWERPRSEGVIRFNAPFHILELGVPSDKWQRGEFVYLLWNVPI